MRCRINNICPTDYADVLTFAGGELGIDRMRFGLVPGWAKGTKAEVGKKFVHTFNARCESILSWPLSAAPFCASVASFQCGGPPSP